MYRVPKSAFLLVLMMLAFAAMTPGAAAQGPPGGLPPTASEVAKRATGLVSGTVDDTLNNVEELVQGLTGGNGQGGGNVPGGVGVLANEQEVALGAVRSGQALPLDEILFIAQLNYEGDVIEVHLVRANSILLYKLTFLAPDGEVFDTFFYAATGIPIDLQP